MPNIVAGRTRGLGIASWVTNLITTGATTFENIASARWGNPPPGTAITGSTNPATGQSSYQVLRATNLPGAQLSTFPSMDFGTGTTDLVKYGLIAAVIIGGISILKKH